MGRIVRYPLLRLLLAISIAVLLVFHARSWSLSQLLWACHIASAVIAIGLVLGHRRVIAVGVVFHAGQGIPAYVLDLFVVGENSITSVLLHTVPIASGAWALWGSRLPRGILLPAWLFHPLAMVAAYFLTDPELNVMLVHKQYGATAWYPSLWLSWVANAAISLGCLTIGWLVMRLIWRQWE
jgi:hypothetical protein